MGIVSVLEKQIPAFEAATPIPVSEVAGFEDTYREETGAGTRLTPLADRFMLLVGDLGALALAQIVAGSIAFGINVQVLNTEFGALEAGELTSRLVRIGFLLMLPVLWWAAKGHYSKRTPFWAEAKEIVKGIALVALVDGFLQYLTKDYFSRLWMLQAWLWALVFIPMARIAMRHVLKRYGSWTAPVLLIGSKENTLEAAQVLESEPYLGYDVAGTLDLAELTSDRNASNPSSLLYRAGGQLSAALKLACERHGARFVVLAPSPEEMASLDHILRALHRARIAFSIIPPVKGIGVMALEAGNFFSHDLVMLTLADNLNRPMARLMKRSFDLAVASLALVLLAPFFWTVSALIRLDGGPAFFSHRRVGEKGRDFMCRKFRTMHVDGDAILKNVLENDPLRAAEWARDQKLRNDPRVTRVGEFLRKTSLDELPQLINVIRGEMSLVGPRPVTYSEVLRYGEDAEYYLSAKPGITGLWQVSGRNDTTYMRRVELDAWYVKNWSLWQDIAIMFKTFPAVLLRRGAC
ncbi:undecaprenyl-phosphate galactose phosphotransferase WbaP [Parvibaculum lavamentivorans]|uniref:undecaprenyl-phosphate galactose phosphotransferase WbaP n=1 Tax=Parvibaculum lavamentivorans TaxID=256618 RepID=UPI0002DC3D8F|nr:undecaprenyl-phosphate galactose phosphotransferase WbaP [Parvibaculum lavamentivorans]